MKSFYISLAAAALTGASAPPTASPPSAPPAETAGTENGFSLDIGKDQHARMTVPVDIGRNGPYRFVVDTGAERTVIARELAGTLRLDPAGMVRVHSMTEVSDIPTVALPTLKVGGKRVRGIKAPALERRNLGAEGMLGVDSLQSQRVSFDFTREEMTVVPSTKREESWANDAIVVVGRSRFGRLVLIDASVEGQKVWVIVDTGTQATVGNTLLRNRLEKKGQLRMLPRAELLSVTGGRITADQSLVRRIRLGGMDISDLPVAFADVHPFKQLGLMDRPALLLGMDALRLFQRVSVDFANRRVRLLSPSRSDLRTGTRLAAKARREGAPGPNSADFRNP